MIYKRNTKPKVLLINPPTTRAHFYRQDNYFPLGLLSLATVLKSNNVEVRIEDVGNFYFRKKISESDLTSYVEDRLFLNIVKYKPDVIGIGCIFSGAFKNLRIIAGKIKKKFPKIPIVIGGMHPTIFTRDILEKYSYIDYIIIGEGESSFWDLVKALTDNNHVISTIDGIGFRWKGDIKINPKTKFIDKLDELPFPDYSILNIKDYYNMDTLGWYSPKKIKVGQPFPILSSRSCPNRCNFCSMWLVHGPRFRYRSPKNVLDEMEHLYRTYDVRYFQFMDDNFTFDKERTLKICKGIIERKMDIQFDTPNGIAINRLDEEVIDTMVAGGMIKICLAVENGSEYIRNKIMRKNLSNEKIYEVFETCAKHKHLFIVAFFIIGMPEETHQTLEETYEMIKKLPFDNIAMSLATPYPGTELFKQCLDNNLLSYKAKDCVDVIDLHNTS